MAYDYDVTIVGGGPIGSTLAYKLAQNGIKVSIIDKKKNIGLPLQCAGIISKEIHELNNLPKELILNEVKGANLHSPHENLTVFKNQTEAYIIDRVAYDKYLIKRAINEGVELINPCKVIGINTKEGLIISQKDQITSKIIVGADGANSIVSKELGNTLNYFNGSQFLLKSDENIQDFDYVDVYAKSDIFPGFIWAIPTYKNIYRVGLFSNHTCGEDIDILENFIKNNPKFKNMEILEKYYGKIPVYDKEKVLVKDRVILIGDAASQVKPTTGGGLILGFKSCEIAKNVIVKVLKNDNINLLKNYEKEFKKTYNKELNYQLKVQKTLNLLSDDDLDYFFNQLKEHDAEELISTYGDMDEQSILVKQFLKKGYLLSMFPSIIKHSVGKIWGLK